MKEWKKVLFLIIVTYMAFMVILYQGHFTFRGLFTNPTTPMRLFESDNVIQGSIRYIIHGTNNTMNTSHSEQYLDIHLEHPELGHTGEVIGKQHGAASDLITIAIGGGLTSKKVLGATESNIPIKFQVFTTLLPSFCQTASPGFEYHFYFAYDQTDKFFSNPKLMEAFQHHFLTHGKKLCSKLTAPIQVHFVQCSHTGSPAWAQNDAMMEAYLDGMEFYYRINDDSQMKSSSWTEAFIKTLASYDPKYVGVVGPKHTGGNTVILTYDFVHRTHINIFGFYYPRFFITWWADDWVTKVYQPGRSTKLAGIKLSHTMKLGQRYKVDYSLGKKVGGQIELDKRTLQRYIKAMMQSKRPKADGTKVISFSLHSRDPDNTMGAIRNAQLMPVYYPGWDMRVYVPDPETATTDLLVPPRIIDSLLRLGVQVAYVNNTKNNIPADFWRYLVADDDQVDIFLVRDVWSRFSDREASAVTDWLNSRKAFHCMRDHPGHKNESIVEGLWGAQAQAFSQLVGSSVAMLLQAGTVNFLQNVLYPIVHKTMYCHDSVTCNKDSYSFPTKRIGTEYVGNKYNRHGLYVDTSHLQAKISAPDCSGQQAKKIIPNVTIKNASIKAITINNSTKQEAAVRNMTVKLITNNVTSVSNITSVRKISSVGKHDNDSIVIKSVEKSGNGTAQKSTNSSISVNNVAVSSLHNHTVSDGVVSGTAASGGEVNGGAVNLVQTAVSVSQNETKQAESLSNGA